MDFDEGFANIVNGGKRKGTAVYHGIDPKTGENLWDVPIATSQDVDDAVRAAQKAFESWSIMPFENRRKHCAEFGQVYKDHMQDFDHLIQKECGKPVSIMSSNVFSTPLHVASH